MSAWKEEHDCLMMWGWVPVPRSLMSSIPYIDQAVVKIALSYSGVATPGEHEIIRRVALAREQRGFLDDGQRIELQRLTGKLMRRTRIEPGKFRRAS